MDTGDASAQDTDRPLNALEQELLDAQAGKMPLKDFLRKLIGGDLYILSASQINEDSSGFRPLVFDRQGVPMAAVFTIPERASMYADVAPYLVQLNGHKMFDWMAPGYGIVINPRHPIGLEILPHGVKEIVRALGETPSCATRGRTSSLRV